MFPKEFQEFFIQLSFSFYLETFKEDDYWLSVFSLLDLVYDYAYLVIIYIINTWLLDMNYKSLTIYGSMREVLNLFSNISTNISTNFSVTKFPKQEVERIGVKCSGYIRKPNFIVFKNIYTIYIYSIPYNSNLLSSLAQQTLIVPIIQLMDKLLDKEKKIIDSYLLSHLWSHIPLKRLPQLST